MSHNAYPTTSDVDDFLEDAGVTNAGASTVAASLAAAIAMWEQLTGWIPFIGEGSDSTTYYTPTGTGYLSFTQGGYVAITSITTALTYENTTGVVRTENLDWWPNPLNGTPILGVKWRGCIWGGERSVKVIGKQGYAVELPDDAWWAIVQGAAAQAYVLAFQLSTGNLRELGIGSGDLDIKFNTTTPDGGWMKVFYQTATTPPYHRMAL